MARTDGGVYACPILQKGIATSHPKELSSLLNNVAHVPHFRASILQSSEFSIPVMSPIAGERELEPVRHLAACRKALDRVFIG